MVDTTTSTTTGRVVPGQRGIRNRHSPFQGRNVQVSWWWYGCILTRHTSPPPATGRVPWISLHSFISFVHCVFFCFTVIFKLFLCFIWEICFVAFFFYVALSIIIPWLICVPFLFFFFVLFFSSFSASHIHLPLHSVVRGLTVIVSSHLPATYGGSPPLSLHFDRIFTPELESSREPRLQQRHHGLLWSGP